MKILLILFAIYWFALAGAAAIGHEIGTVTQVIACVIAGLHFAFETNR